MVRELQKQINKICAGLFDIEAEAELSRPEEKFGDFATNTALKLGNRLGKNPREIAGQIAAELKKDKWIDDVNIAGPGFINITLKDEVLFDLAKDASRLEKTLTGKRIVTEYSDPNPFKVLHAGHLYTSVVGDSISNLLEAAGGEVHRVNYGGDVGLHVAKAIWAILERLGGEEPQKLEGIKPDNRADWLAECYVAGTRAYEDDEAAKTSIVELNKKIYKISAANDKVSPLGKIYWQTRDWSYDYFDKFYARLGVKFEKYYPESTVAELGLKKVGENTPKIYSKSDGAVVYEGEKDGLHTRVFVTQGGLPTYEAKEVGLIFQKDKDYGFDRSVVITANEISQYMQVVLKSIEGFAPELVKKTTHLTHGLVKLPGAEKMSSRKGNIIKAADILDLAEKYSREINKSTSADIVVGAVKYSFLKSSLGGDVIYDAKESVAVEGNSGPYLQYALVRAKGILNKASPAGRVKDGELDPAERSLARKISMYPEVFEVAVGELSPHHVSTYLYELAQTFNRFYENNRVIDDPRADLRLQLVEGYKDILVSGLGLLGISTPEKM